MQMAGNASVLESLLEIVDSVQPSENVDTIDFSWDGKEGAYIVVSIPVGTSAVAAEQTGIQTMQMIYFSVTGKTAPVIRSPYTIMSRKTPIQTTDIDYWAPVVTPGDGTISVKMISNGSYGYIAGFTYYLMRAKGI